MNAIPAQVAGVGEIVMVVPTPRGERNPLVLAAARVAGVDRVFTIGGAQAIGALAYGTRDDSRASTRSPARATPTSRAPSGACSAQVGIDMIAGPSEILVLADGTTPADWVAMDLFSQAEHDELAQSILLCPDAGLHRRGAARRSSGCCRRCRAREIIRASLEGRGALIRTRSMEEACAISNRIAPEHLEISAARAAALGAAAAARRRDLPRRLHQREPRRLLRRPEPRAADRGTARFSSPLGVYDFQKRTSLIEVSERGARGARRRSPPSSRTAKGCRRMRARPRCGSKERLDERRRRPRPLRTRDPPGRAVDARLRDPARAPASSSSTRWRTRSACPRRCSASSASGSARSRSTAIPARCVGDVIAALARYVELPAGCKLMLGNGSDELISLLALACDVPGATILAPLPGLRDVRDVGAAAGPEVRRRAADRRLRARRGGDAGGDRAAPPGDHLHRLSEQPDRQPVRRGARSSASSPRSARRTGWSCSTRPTSRSRRARG